MDQQVGPFELVRCIGKGATASVFLAYEPIWRKDVAIKRLKHSENSKRLIAHEVETMTKLAHENLARMYTKLDKHGCTYIVMDFLGGGDLFDLVRRWKKEGRERQTFHYFNQLLTGLKFLHNLGFAHRDLKLENLMLSTEGVLKIADFGVSKELHLNPMRTCCGSPDYIAPEIIIQKEGYDGKLADLWSCGVIFFAMMTGEFPFENANFILKGVYKTPKLFPVLAKESLIERIFVVDPAKRIQSVEEIQATLWMQQFNDERNTFSMFLNVLLEIKHLKGKNASSKIGGVLQCRFQFLRIMLLVKVIRALKEPSIKGAPRDVRAVFQDRLYSVLQMLQTCVKALPQSKRALYMDESTHEVNWGQLRESSQYCTHLKLLSECHRAHIGDLSDDDKLALFLNMYHLVLIHGFANAGCSLKDMRKDVQAAFFDNTAIVVGFIQFSLKDIHMGILRANQPKPGGGFFGTTTHFSETLYPDKIALSRPSLDPIVHCCLSNLTSQSPRIVVYEGSRVHEQMREVATAFIRKQVTFTNAGLTLPNVFKEFSKDFGKTEAEKIAFVKNMMDDNSQQQLGSLLNRKGECGVTYLPKVKSFAWQHLPEVKQWDQQQEKRFEWTEAKQKAWRDKQGAMTISRTSSWASARDAFGRGELGLGRTSSNGSARDGFGRGELLRRTSSKGSIKDLLLAASVRGSARDGFGRGELLSRTSSKGSIKDLLLAASVRSPRASPLLISPTSSLSRASQGSDSRSISPTSSILTDYNKVRLISPTSSLGSTGMAEILANDSGWSGDQETPRRRSKSSSGKKSKKAAGLVGAGTESPLKKEPKAKKKKEGKEPRIKGYTKVIDCDDMIDVIAPLPSQPEEAGSEMIEAIEIAKEQLAAKDAEIAALKVQLSAQTAGGVGAGGGGAGGAGASGGTSEQLAAKDAEIAALKAQLSASKQKKIKKKKANDEEDEERNVSNSPSSHRSRDFAPEEQPDKFVRRQSADLSVIQSDLPVTAEQFKEATEVLRGRPLVSMQKKDSALVLVKNKDGVDEEKYLPQQDRLQLMQESQILSRTFLMSQTANPKSLAALKRQPEIMTRYSKKNSTKKNSSVSAFCVVS